MFPICQKFNSIYNFVLITFLGDPRVNTLYKKVGCVFNHRTFYANVQDSENPYYVDFNLEDEYLWKSMDMNKISSVKST